MGVVLTMRSGMMNWVGGVRGQHNNPRFDASNFYTPVEAVKSREFTLSAVTNYTLQF